MIAKDDCYISFTDSAVYFTVPSSVCRDIRTASTCRAHSSVFHHWVYSPGIFTSPYSVQASWFSLLISRLSGLDLSPGQGYCTKTRLCSRSAQGQLLLLGYWKNSLFSYKLTCTCRCWAPRSSWLGTLGSLKFFLDHSLGWVLGRDTLLPLCLSPPRIKWVPAKLLLGVALRWTSIPSGGGGGGGEKKYIHVHVLY